MAGKEQSPGGAGKPDDPGRDGQSMPCYNSDSLFAGANQVVIRHAGETYYLRITRNSKLILTK